MRRGLVILPGVLVAACAAAGPSAPSPVSPTTPTPSVSVVASASAPIASTPLARATPPATSGASASPRPSATATPLKTGWPTVGRSGVTMTAEADVEPPPFEGCPGPAPALVVAVTLTGLAPGEAVPLSGTATYDFGMLACGVEPSPCVWGSGTTDPAIHLCRPEYSEAAKGTVGASATATADAKGSVTATLRFVIPESEQVCPAGGSRPWYLESGEWTALVTDTTHGLRLVGPPDLVIGP
jgi:hypothetical protein